MKPQSKIIKKAGFSLVELLVTITIISLLAGIAVPNYVRYKKKADLTTIHAQVLEIVKDFNICMTENSEDTSFCFDSIKTTSKSSRIKHQTFNMDSKQLAKNRYVFTGELDSDTYTKVCIHLNDEGNLRSLSYDSEERLCYRAAIPSKPIKSCNNDSECGDVSGRCRGNRKGVFVSGKCK